MFTRRGAEVSSQTRLYGVRTNSRTAIILCPVSDVLIDSNESPGCSVEISGDLHGKNMGLWEGLQKVENVYLYASRKGRHYELIGYGSVGPVRKVSFEAWA